MRKETKQVAQILSDIFAGNKGRFFSIKNYENSHGEIADHICRTAMDFFKLKQQDVKTLRNCPESILKDVSKDKGISMETVEKAYNEILIAAVRNLDADTATAQSKGQTEAYTNFGNGVKVHNESDTIKLLVFRDSKKVHKEGVYPTVNSRPKTIAKNAIKKALNLKELKYKYFTIKNPTQLTVNGTDIHIK